MDTTISSIKTWDLRKGSLALLWSITKSYMRCKNAKAYFTAISVILYQLDAKVTDNQQNCIVNSINWN